jgi:hypothetical protein
MRLLANVIAVQHHGVTINAWNCRFAVDLLGARPRHSKSFSDQLAIAQDVCNARLEFLRMADGYTTFVT